MSDPDLRQDQALARLRVAARRIPPPLDVQVLERAFGRIDRRRRREAAKARRTVPLESLLDEPAGPDMVAAHDSLDRYRNILARLESVGAAVLDHAIQLGMTRREISQVLGLSTRATSKRRERALTQARKLLDDPGRTPRL